jgi:hypothetical protein
LRAELDSILKWIWMRGEGNEWGGLRCEVKQGRITEEGSGAEWVVLTPRYEASEHIYKDS